MVKFVITDPKFKDMENLVDKLLMTICFLTSINSFAWDD